MGMSIYDINSALQDCVRVNPETGETTIDEELFGQLSMMRQDKLENIACWIKNLTAEGKAYADEIRNLQTRKAHAETLCDRLTDLLAHELNGERINTPKVSVTYRKSIQVIVDDAEKLFKKFLRVKTEPDKTAIKDALSSGVKVRGAHLEEKSNIQIK